MDTAFAALAVPAALALCFSPLWPAIALCSALVIKDAFNWSFTGAGITVPAAITFLGGAAIHEMRNDADLILGLLIIAAFSQLWDRRDAWSMLGIQTPERVIVLEAVLALLASYLRNGLLESGWLKPPVDAALGGSSSSPSAQPPAARPATALTPEVDLAAFDKPLPPVLFTVATLLVCTALISVVLLPLVVLYRRAAVSRESSRPRAKRGVHNTTQNGVSALSAALTSDMGRSVAFYSTILLVCALCVYPLLVWKHGMDPFYWLHSFVCSMQGNARVSMQWMQCTWNTKTYLLTWWFVVLAIMAVVSHSLRGAVAPLRSHAYSPALVIHRKLFHAVIVLIVLPALCLGPEAHALLAIASAGCMLLLVCIELGRSLCVSPTALSGTVNGYMSRYVDGRDSGALYATHLYLLAACAAPVWLSYARPRWPGLPPVPSALELSAGALAVGVGDAAAAIVGVGVVEAGKEGIGRGGWTWAQVVDDVLTRLGSPDDDEDEEGAESAADKEHVGGTGHAAQVGRQAGQASGTAATTSVVRRRKPAKPAASQSSQPPLSAAEEWLGGTPGSGNTTAQGHEVDRPVSVSKGTKRTAEEIFTFAGSRKTVQGSVSFVVASVSTLILLHWVRCSLSLSPQAEEGAWPTLYGALVAPHGHYLNPSSLRWLRWVVKPTPSVLVSLSAALYWLVACTLMVLFSAIETFGGGIDNAGLPIFAWVLSALAADWLEGRVLSLW